MTQAISTIIPSRVLWAAWLISVPVNRKQDSHFFIPLKDKQTAQGKILICEGQQNTACTSERLREESVCSWQAVGSEMVFLSLIAHHNLHLHRETTRTMATVPVKEAEMGLRCLLESNYLDPTQTTRGTDRRTSDPLKERWWRKFVPTPLCPLLPSTWLKSCSEDNHCCSGACHAPLMFTPSFLRKGKSKPKSISPEVTLCQGTPDIFVALLLLKKKETPFFFDSSIQLHVPHRAGQLWRLSCFCDIVWQKCNSVLMLPVWQEAVSLTKERNMIGFRRHWVFSCSGTAVWSLRRMLAVAVLSSKKSSVPS